MHMFHHLLDNMDITIGFITAMTLGTLCMLMFMEWLALGAFVAAGVYMEKFFIRIRPQKEKEHKTILP